MIIRYRSYRLETYVTQDTKRNDGKNTYIGYKLQVESYRFACSLKLAPCSYFLISEKILSQNPKVFVYISESFFLFFSAPDEDSIASNDFLWTRYRGLIPTGELFYYISVKLMYE